MRSEPGTCKLNSRNLSHLDFFERFVSNQLHLTAKLETETLLYSKTPFPSSTNVFFDHNISPRLMAPFMNAHVWQVRRQDWSDRINIDNSRTATVAYGEVPIVKGSKGVTRPGLVYNTTFFKNLKDSSRYLIHFTTHYIYCSANPQILTI